MKRRRLNCLRPPQRPLVLLITIFACAAALILSVLNPGHRHPGGLFPQIRVRVWTPALLAYNLLLWAVHPSVYEFMIRGLVLHVMLPSGMWTAANADLLPDFCYKGSIVIPERSR